MRIIPMSESFSHLSEYLTVNFAAVIITSFSISFDDSDNITVTGPGVSSTVKRMSHFSELS